MTGTGGGGVALARSIAQASRPAGSAAEAAARAACAGFLEARGFEVTEQSFEYSAWVGRRLVPFVGGWLAFFAFAAAASILLRSLPAGETVGIAGGVSIALVAAAWVNTRWGVLRSHRMRARGVNLVARRGVPNIWLMAHLDTKGQPVPLAVRAGGVVLILAGWLVTLVASLVYALGSPGALPAIVGGLILAGIGAVPLAASIVTDRGTGALDNASGIATIFEAVDRLPSELAIGVVVTTAEELALAGARAWAASRSPGVAINCDGVDDEGAIACIVARDPAGRLRQAIGKVELRNGGGARVRRSLPGVLFDSVALAEAGWVTMTVARGTLRSLARVHTPGDTLAAWTGRGVAGTAAFVAAVASEIAGGPGGDHPAWREE